MSLKHLPPHVRAHVYVTWVGIGLSALGIGGFFLSFDQVAGPSRWAVGVHHDIPWGAYIAIFAWVAGLVITWYGRRQIDAAVRRRRQEMAEASRVDIE
ncbi:MAG: hypothetical protein N3B11_04270 [Coriobacteriia bacterium]|nr:hypothetical protein [Coriobacteriia bacterium]